MLSLLLEVIEFESRQRLSSIIQLLRFKTNMAIYSIKFDMQPLLRLPLDITIVAESLRSLLRNVSV